MRIIIAFVLLLYALPASAQSIETVVLESKVLGENRELLIYLPRNYNKSEVRKYKVVYVLDAQVREYFDIAHSTMNFVGGFDHPMIVVGIVSKDRNKDLLPDNQHPETVADYQGSLGNADKFLSFISDEVIPFVDRNYNTLPTKIALGHSNGGTFLIYSLINKPTLFDAFIIVSPNMAYDRQELVKALEGLKSGSFNSGKYVYLCNANEAVQWPDWKPAHDKTVALFNKIKMLHFVADDFSATQDHLSVFPPGVFNGLKGYLENQFYNVPNAIKYYEGLEQKHIISLNAATVNAIAQGFFLKGKTWQAIEMAQWGAGRFPEDHQLHDSLGEFYESTGNAAGALLHYKKALELLEKEKGKTDPDAYAERFSFYTNNINRLIKS